MYLYTMYNTSYRHVYCGPAHTWIPLVKDSPFRFHRGPLLSGRDNCEASRKGCTSLLHSCPLGMRKDVAEIYEDIERFEHFRLFMGHRKTTSWQNLGESPPRQSCSPCEMMVRQIASLSATSFLKPSCILSHLWLDGCLVFVSLKKGHGSVELRTCRSTERMVWRKE